MSLAEVLPLAIDLNEEDRIKLMHELATSMALEVIDLEVEQRRLEIESDPEAWSLSPDQLKADLQKLRDGR
jgi:hypothetical protein